MTMTLAHWSHTLFTAFLVFFLHMKHALGFFSGGDANIMCIERERQALLTFKQGLVDDYGHLSSWSSENDCCKWRGIQCSNHTGHVIMLDLNLASLRGKLSPSLLELWHLNYLDLGYNNFNSVTNLEWLTHFTSLKYLNLSGMNLSKAKYWLQVVNSLHRLIELRLRSCNLPNIIPPSLSMINSSTYLAVLNLSNNSLTSSVFKWLFNYSSSLVKLYLYDNMVQGLIPDAFGNMTSLETFDLGCNQLEGGIPKSFGNMCTLHALYLDGNNLSGQLCGFVRNLSRCSKYSLETLYLSENQITGSMPDFTVLSSLKQLSLSSNRLDGIETKSIGQLSKLEYLYIGHNSLQGVVSEYHLSNLSSLKVLDLSFNLLALNLSSDWVPPFNLDKIGLASCKLGPNFPNWIRTQRNFSSLDISSSGISDTIPEWFWGLSTRVAQLNLSFNNIYGNLPILLIKSSNFPVIDLSSNQLGGPLPTIPSNCTYLDLSNNRFSESIYSLCKITHRVFGYLDLSNNLLSGELPDCFVHKQEVVILNLANNNLSGEIPTSMGSLVQLQSLDLRNNSFFGELPSSFKNLSRLQFLDLSKNKFTGKMPTWIGESLQSLVVLSLHSNQFYKRIPMHLCQLIHIQTLDLSENNFSGPIPKCLNNFIAMARKENLSINRLYKSLSRDFSFSASYHENTLLVWKGKEQEYGSNLGLQIFIDLSSNKLTGEIPREISSLLELKSLNLSRNKLSGTMFEGIGQMKQLESLDLSRNRLSGQIPASMSTLNFLANLDLSYNNLSGRIPSSTQLQSFNASSFVGNNGALCGPPLPQKCLGDETSSSSPPTNGDNKDIQDDEDEFRKWFCAGMGTGFIVGFWGVCSALLLRRSWRHAYFKLLDKLNDWLYVTIVVHVVRFKRKFHSCV